MGIVTFSKLGRFGRTGNQLFQVAFCLAYAKRHNLELRLPNWKYASYFKSLFPQSDLSGDFVTVKEKEYHYTDYSDLDHSQNLDFEGYFQSYKYFSDYQGLIQKQFTFDPDFIKQVRQPYEQLFQKPTIAIHARKGDYVGNDYYEQLPVLYYIKALFEHFPNWRDCNLLFFSDGIEWLKLHFSCLENAHFIEGQSDIADLCLMSQCTNFIVANSSFSWWSAWLAERPGTKIVRPAHHFNRGKQDNDIKDLYPPHWEICDHKDGWKIDLSDVTFMVPCHRDHKDREENLSLTLQFLQSHFNTNFIIGEQGTSAMEKYVPDGGLYVKFPYPEFHRTRMLNQMAELSETPIIVNWDADVLTPPMQVLEAVERIRLGADVVYPYSGRFIRLPRLQWLKKLQRNPDIGITAETNFPLIRKGDAQSTGGAVFFWKESFFEGGGENENLISFSPDDAERYHRFATLGYDVQRVPGAIYHLEHWCGLNSGVKHPRIDANREEWHKVAAMDKEELSAYVEMWEWTKEVTT